MTLSGAIEAATATVRLCSALLCYVTVAGKVPSGPGLGLCGWVEPDDLVGLAEPSRYGRQELSSTVTVLLFWFATARSRFPSPLRSTATIPAGSVPVG